MELPIYMDGHATTRVDPRVVGAMLRFGLGRFNTEAEVDRVADALCVLVERLRAPAPIFEVGDDDSAGGVAPVVRGRTGAPAECGKLRAA